jgi:anthranilate synthase/aminodeoxychorismate synthase-like glutamine amidotransferase
VIPENEHVLVLDHRDSFVFNLVDELRATGAVVTTLRSDLLLDELEHKIDSVSPRLVVLSPGPGIPEDAGVMVEWLRTDPKIPVLGICLGHQALAVAAGGSVGRAPRPVHGGRSEIRTCGDEPSFIGLGPSFVAARYHSLVVTEVPASMKVVATTEEAGTDLVMGLRHRERPRLGLQFHPESILTPNGRGIVWRFYEEALTRGGIR